MFGKIALGMRCYGDPKSDFFACLLKVMRKGLRGNDIILEPVLRGNIVQALKMLCMDFLASEADTLFLLEDDVVFKPDDLDRLRQSISDHDVLSALFCARRSPFNPQIFRSVRRDLNRVDDLKGIVDVEAVPFGFCLIRRKVVEKVMERQKNTALRWSLRDECISFCEDARICGAKIGVNTDVSIEHLIPGVTVRWNKEENKPEFNHDNFRY